MSQCRRRSGVMVSQPTLNYLMICIRVKVYLPNLYPKCGFSLLARSRCKLSAHGQFSAPPLQEAGACEHSQVLVPIKVVAYPPMVRWAANIP